jgi:hypothetical protein
MSKSIIIDGVKYIAESEIKSNVPAKSLKGLPYKIIRTYSAGVFAGYLKKREGKEAVILNARRLWYWDGSASLSQLAVEGVKKPENCKFPCEVDEITVTEAIEILDVSKVAQESIISVPIWKA